MVILITGARAPVALEWARIALSSGHQVWLADSLRCPLGKYLQGIQGYLLLPAPVGNQQAYCQAVTRLIDEYQIDMVIPTCEEVFYLTQAKTLAQPHRQSPVQWFMPETNLLYRLHDKFESLSILNGLGGVLAPETRLLSTPSDIQNDPNTILKPVYSRFGRQIIRQPHKHALTETQLSADCQWVQQRKIQGQAICNYALFEAGTLIVHQAYLPKYCINQSAASYFEPYIDKRLEEFCTQFGQKTGYHGQVAFDFIEESGQLYVLECNPRATSGLHLIREQLSLSSSGHLSHKKRHPEQDSSAYRVGLSLLILFIFPSIKDKTLALLIKDHKRATDAFADKAYPLLKRATWLSALEMIYRAIRFKRPLSHASTYDIEWNGTTDQPHKQKRKPHARS